MSMPVAVEADGVGPADRVVRRVADRARRRRVAQVGTVASVPMKLPSTTLPSRRTR